jgi:site-specific DNA-methyltransferase (adenine-specific)
VPFVGSGSECVSAKKNNINYIGFEINNDYIVIANERLQGQ